MQIKTRAIQACALKAQCNENTSSKNEKKESETLLHPALFRQFIHESALKLSQDECYSEVTMLSFKNTSVSHEEALITSKSRSEGCYQKF